MIGAFLALCLAGGEPPAELQWDEGGPSPFLRLRAGAWGGREFEFEATRADGTFVRINEEALLSGGLDAGFEFSRHYVLFATYEVDLTDDIFADLAGLCVGYKDRADVGKAPAIPDEVTIYAGGFISRLEVRERGFGDFDDSVGFRAGILFTWFVSRRIAVSAVGEYRLVEYEYEEDITSDDDEIGGSTGWVGLGLDLRF